jgi:hypothetical protein
MVEDTIKEVMVVDIIKVVMDHKTLIMEIMEIKVDIVMEEEDNKVHVLKLVVLHVLLQLAVVVFVI